ncbi:MAG: hypothetical protein ACE14S_05865 [Candidatus Bathyarchaeia archaeon]
MSLRLGADKVQEGLVLALMIVFMFAVVYSSIDLTYKIGIGALVFSIILVASVASQGLKQQQDQDKSASK